MFVEIFLVGAILVFILYYNGSISGNKFTDDNKDILLSMKESDYDFLLIAKYGDRVYDPNAVFMKRVKNAFLIFSNIIIPLLCRQQL